MLETVEHMRDVNTEGKIDVRQKSSKEKNPVCQTTWSIVIKLPVNCQSYFWGKRKAFDQNMKKHNQDDVN